MKIRPTQQPVDQAHAVKEGLKFLDEIDARIASDPDHAKAAMTWRNGHGHVIRGTVAEFRTHYAMVLYVMLEIDCRVRGVPTGMESAGVGASAET